MTRPQHEHKVHLYQKVERKKSTIYKCMLSGCTHFVYPDLLPGRLCVCYVCESVFELTKKLISQRTKIKCSDCRANVPLEKRQRKLKAGDKVSININSPVIDVSKDKIEDVVGGLLDNLFKV